MLQRLGQRLQRVLVIAALAAGPVGAVPAAAVSPAREAERRQLTVMFSVSRGVMSIRVSKCGALTSRSMLVCP